MKKDEQKIYNEFMNYVDEFNSFEIVSSVQLSLEIATKRSRLLLSISFFYEYLLDNDIDELVLELEFDRNSLHSSGDITKGNGEYIFILNGKNNNNMIFNLDDIKSKLWLAINEVAPKNKNGR